MLFVQLSDFISSSCTLVSVLHLHFNQKLFDYLLIELSQLIN